MGNPDPIYRMLEIKPLACKYHVSAKNLHNVNQHHPAADLE
jgi:hypothetical protein